MKKIIITSMLLLLLITMGSCKSNDNKSNNLFISSDDLFISSNENVEITSTQDAYTSTEVTYTLWQSAYISFLKEFSVSDDYTLDFSLRDLDNDKIPELIIIKSKEKEQKRIISVYSYNDNVFKAGEMDNPNSFAGAFYFSNNPKFPGLFSRRWGGGIENCGYLSVNDGKLNFEKLYYIDRTGDAPQQVDISDNKELIKESLNVIPLNDDHSTVFMSHNPINEENIYKIIGSYK